MEFARLDFLHILRAHDIDVDDGALNRKSVSQRFGLFLVKCCALKKTEFPFPCAIELVDQV